MTAYSTPRKRPGPALGLRTLLLHGLGGSPQDWDECLRRPSDSYSFWDVGLPWGTFGNRGWAIEGAACRTVVEAIDSLPRREDRSCVDVLVAHSFSANVVLELLAGHHPIELKGLVLVSPSVAPEPFDWSEVARRVEQFPTVLEEGVARKGRRLDEKKRRVIALRLRDMIGPLAWLRSLEFVLRNAELDLNRITLPVLIIAGDADSAVPLSGLQRLARKLPNATFVALSGCGHFPMAEQPARFMTALEEFAENLRTPLTSSENSNRSIEMNTTMSITTTRSE